MLAIQKFYAEIIEKIENQILECEKNIQYAESEYNLKLKRFVRDKDFQNRKEIIEKNRKKIENLSKHLFTKKEELKKINRRILIEKVVKYVSITLIVVLITLTLLFKANRFVFVIIFFLGLLVTYIDIILDRFYFKYTY